MEHTARTFPSESPAAAKPDAQVYDYGTIILLSPLTSQAELWLQEHIAEDALYFAGALAVERRYVLPIVVAMRDEGLSLAHGWRWAR